ncbi:hypothetical protein PHLCEN_2v10290 [Hermanssonia centrifuga]|uniref:Uncharacterized protein n=1 Tax=Hermanssonia centrifuga TaxID=98765 RepID=A0A2R6NNB6_9APHY|nr:hypothetical protein PHLCEN_2v10290 [Hermanssonia centrifuga]
MDVLKRFEEEAAEDEAAIFGPNDEESSDDENDLENRLEKVDLDHASYDELWSALTPAERDKFLKALNDPSSELAQQLLASEELEEQTVEPWWDRPSDYEKEEQDAMVSVTKISRRYGARPAMMDVSAPVMNASAGVAATGPSLLYNICAVLMAYAYVTRYLSTSPVGSILPEDAEHEEARRMFTRLVPFLTDRKSKTVLPSLSGVITDLWSRFEPETMTPKFFSLLMQDAAKLLRPAPVLSLSPTHLTSPTKEFDVHPSANALLALSDVSTLFAASPPRPPHSRAPNPTVAKLAFYGARIISTPTYILTALADETSVRANLLEREGKLDAAAMSDHIMTGSSRAQSPSSTSATPAGPSSHRPRIEELT